MNEQPINPGNTELILPIVCPYCQRELNLSMLFGLLAPTENIAPSSIPEINIEEKENEST